MANAVEEALLRASEKDKKLFEATKAHIASVENTDKISPSNAPSNAPANPKDLDKKQLDAATQSNIQSIQKGEGNNYQNKNAVDRAQERPSKEPQKAEPEQDKER